VWGAFPTRDGYICIAGVDEKRWPSFCKIVGIQHLETDPEYSDNVVRNFHGEKIQKVLDEIFPQKTSQEWLKQLTDADILATEVVDYRTMLKSEQARVNGYLLELDHPVAGKVLVSGTPITINGEVTTIAEAAPEHGQHTEEVLLELGYSWEEIGALRDSGAV
jgi:crotonobetainyl-CoA:carnitine CoA-transferase CaiB-like acyl-CoA transferase